MLYDFLSIAKAIIILEVCTIIIRLVYDSKIDYL